MATNNKKASTASILQEVIGGLNVETPELPDDLLGDEEDKVEEAFPNTMVETSTIIDDTEGSLTLNNFCKKYLVETQSSKSAKKTNVAVNAELYEMLKTVVFHIGPRCALSSYLENIITAHLSHYKDFLNEEIERNRASITID
ncbi:DUF3408 domain-containing protein [Porphyromonas levii]|uniref:DUF3408 domain-containing protein n=1 Tax=Porphyromonas levii TaxID=28114 RepID=UPI00035C273B|nr:DUF3408 domain-containing protein [Porphyromonas levii]